MKFDLPPPVVDVIIKSLRKRKWEVSHDALTLVMQQLNDPRLQNAVIVAPEELEKLRKAAAPPLLPTVPAE